MQRFAKQKFRFFCLANLRQELLDFASKWPELKKILPEHCTELDKAGDHFFDFIINKLFTG